MHVVCLLEAWQTFIPPMLLFDGSCYPNPQTANLAAGLNKAAEYIVLRMTLRRGTIACTFQILCSSNLPRAGNVLLACRVSLYESAHGQSHWKKQNGSGEPHEEMWGTSDAPSQNTYYATSIQTLVH